MLANGLILTFGGIVLCTLTPLGLIVAGLGFVILGGVFLAPLFSD